ncbi:thymidine phosphorylase-like isoform X2 [Tubulanus polymorphus]|uniref:thymidine phosphorylase-like isoform X2 n=1 Tax=Tubulanus polymorphus TaxID=672921 RepID=UPI003DA4117A
MPATDGFEPFNTSLMDHEDAAVMVTQTLIDKKKDGEELDEDEIHFFVKGVVEEEIRQSQLGAMLMAIYVKGMTVRETVHLTNQFMHSGALLTWPDDWRDLVVDKHSTGGVGDKVSIPLAPALIACGLKVPMMAGRSLEHTGGTIDKLESIPGYNPDQNISSMETLLGTVGGCIVSQTKQLNPADRIFYATRNVTSTVANIPLIVASIVSKKAVEGISCLVLDVKFGTAAFMKTKENALRLAKNMVEVGKGLGMKIAVCLSRMDHPIGFMVGNALEIEESIQCMKGEGPDDLDQLVVAQVILRCSTGGVLLYLANQADSVDLGKAMIRNVLNDGSALIKFQEMLIAQGVSTEESELLCDPDGDVWNVMTKAKHTVDILANKSGYVHDVDAMTIAKVGNSLGAGRKRVNEPLNHAVGLELKIRVGDYIKQDDVWIKVHHDLEEFNDQFIGLLNQAIRLGEGPCERPSRVEQIILPD